MSEHPLRRRVVGEMHLRRWPRLSPPAQVVQVLRLLAPHEREGARALLADLPRGGFLAPSEALASEGLRHAEGDMAPGIAFAWELHAEACGITLFRRAPDADMSEALDWMARCPGQVIRATRIRLCASVEEARALLPEMGFVGSDLVSCEIGATGGEQGGRPVARMWSDFRIGPDGFGASLVALHDADACDSGDIARLLQAFQELGNYRNLALMGLPEAQAHWSALDAAEERLRDLAGDVAAGAAQGAGPAMTDDALLARVSAISLDLMHVAAQTGYRMNATEAYARLAEERLAALAVRPVAGHPSLVDFTQRRLLPAVRTCSAFARRVDQLQARAARFAALLRTRVETHIENQNGRLLRSMERSASLQLRLQQLVEGLSVVALSYYAVALLGYVFKGAEEIWPHLPAPLIIGLMVPLVVAGTWWAIHRMKARLLGHDEAH
ncbi:MAG TPA: DUF3422 domain-containing protein [Novosphingobium sp.]|nr:DUF3422 domain-containing protein [Novosphingobium sp.]